MKGLKLFAERILGSLVFFFCVVLGIKVEPVEEELANVKQLVRRRPRWKPTPVMVVIEFGDEAVFYLKKAGQLILVFALMYLLFCIAFAM